MIGSVKRDGSMLRIYDENGDFIVAIDAWDGLEGYTSTTVSVKAGSRTRIYDEDGNFLRDV